MFTHSIMGYQVLRRRGDAMSPREKWFIALISLVLCAISIVCVVVYYIPTFFYIAFILGVCCVACYYQSGESLYARLGPDPRRGLTIPPALRRWLPGVANGVPTAGRVRTRTVKGDVKESVVFTSQRRFENTIYRKDSDSYLFSPRDILMGSYIGKTESPPSFVGRPRAGGSSGSNPNAREQLRERLARPNHAVYTPNKRLSFGGEPLGTMGRFTITPQRHYPIQQMGTSSVGILPPAQWDSFRKKNILTPRNSPAVHSPVTVKIARPDNNTIRSPFLEHVTSPRVIGSPGPRATADPCSRETVLSVLKESRKRDVDDDDQSFTAGQKSKRRRHDSSGSAHSAFESLLLNGAPSQLMPKPGTLKRGLNVMTEELTMKRSRTSSVSSVSCGLTPSGTLGSVRNSIRSSLSSSQGLTQPKKASTRSLSPLSSPGSSRSQTPERASKKPREEDVQSPSSVSSVRSDKTLADTAPATGKLTPVPTIPVASFSSDLASSGKRKRKIPLVSSRRGDQISLPPPPELGYTITVKDLDQEKKAALSQINTVLKVPEPEELAPAVTTSSQPPVSSSVTPTLATLLASPLPVTMSASIPVINLDPVPPCTVSTAPTSTAPQVNTLPAANPLLESLKMMRNTAAPAISLATVSTTLSPLAPAEQKSDTSFTGPRPAPASLSQAPPASLSQAPPASLSQAPPASLSQAPPASLSQATNTIPSAFTQVLSQVTNAPSSVPNLGGASLFGLASPLTALSSSTTTTSTASTGTTSTNHPLLASGFKPIFGAASPAPTVSEATAAVPTFKPIFGSATATSAFGQPAATSAPSTATAPASLFTGLSNSTTVAPAPSTNTSAPPSVKSLFGNWSGPPATTAATTTAPPTGSTFQFGAASTAAPAAALSSTSASTTTSNTGFLFGAMVTTSAAVQPPAQGGFSFGQAAASQNSTTASFGGFGMATTTAAAAPSSQSTFTFGKSSFEAPAASAFPGVTQAPSATATAKPFTFGSAGASAAPAPFAFGAATTTAAPTFGTPTVPHFGASSTGFAFGNAKAAPATPAAPAFGSAIQTASTLPASAPTFSFGGVSAQQVPATPAQPTTGGFNFGAAISGTPFGTPSATTQTPGFNFGAAASDKLAFGTSTPAFGQSTATGPIPFGSPGTPVQGFSAMAPSPFGSSPSAPSFSIGAGSKTSGARQRLQARRQHPRKK
uniref:POM121 transmembrane nucleoporin n=2 Tax=Esox lucius TaxID=8010 RepID=A0AAY5K1K6_ESOLU